MSASPVARSERIEFFNVLRGLAVFGILLVNIVEMGLPAAAVFNPAAFGWQSPLDKAVWLLTYIFVEGKMRTIFTLLFGAGACLFIARFEQRTGRSAARIHFRRCLILALVGAVHGLIWHGDILLGYGIVAPLIYPARNWSPLRLYKAGALLLLPLVALSVAASFLPGVQAQFEQRQRQGVLTAAETEELETIRSVMAEVRPAAADTGKEIMDRRGRLSAIRWNIERRSLAGVLLLSLCDALSMFLIGAGLWKAGILTGERSNSFYWRMAAVGSAVGLPLLSWTALRWTRDGFPIFLDIGVVAETARVAVALSYISLLALARRAGLFSGAARILAAAGRMALTNYVGASAIALLIFSGFGLGLFAKLSRAQLLIPVAGIWAMQLLFSHWWMARHDFGPLERWWRHFTYGGFVRQADQRD